MNYVHTTSYVIALCVALSAGSAAVAQSTCYGSTSDGAIEQACRLEASGPNFEPYTHLGRWLGRTWVHCTVAEVVAKAYQSLAAQRPHSRYVYGETGLRNGGEFKPHRTHRNGLSVDFMVPVLNAQDRSVALPTGITNKFGYNIEFDTAGKFDHLRIDYEAMAAHLLALEQAALAHGTQIERVIFAPELQQALRQSSAWPKIRHLEYSRKTAWVRHDEHYHVDFRIRCQPITEWRAR